VRRIKWADGCDVWRATRADSSFPLDKFQAMATRNVVIIKIPVQPTPAVS